MTAATMREPGQQRADKERPDMRGVPQPRHVPGQPGTAPPLVGAGWRWGTTAALQAHWVCRAGHRAGLRRCWRGLLAGLVCVWAPSLCSAS